MELYFKEMPKSILLVLKCTLEPANVDSENMDTYIIHALSGVARLQLMVGPC